jgi:hypothetical protein
MALPAQGRRKIVSLVDPDGNVVDVVTIAGVRRLAVDASVSVVVEPTPGTTVTTGANTAVGIGATVALPVPPSGTLSQSVQNVSAGATELLVRETPGAAGTGMRLPRLGIFSYNEAVDSLEVEHASGPVGVAAIQWERM